MIGVRYSSTSFSLSDKYMLSYFTDSSVLNFPILNASGDANDELISVTICETSKDPAKIKLIAVVSSNKVLEIQSRFILIKLKSL